MDIRPATADDARQIARVHVETWRAAYRGQIPDAILNALDVDRRARFWEGRLTRQTSDRVFVSEHAGAIAGFVDLIPSRDKDANASTIAEIAALYVLPEHWRKGFGRALCLRALDEARNQGYSGVTLWVLASNLPAHHFYQSVGFVLDGGKKAEKTEGGTALHEVRFRIELRHV